MLVIVLIVFTCLYSGHSAPASPTKSQDDDADRPTLKIIKHQPALSKGNSYEKIRFPNLKDAPLKDDKNAGQGCYIIRGPVQVKKTISGDVQVYIQVRVGPKSKPIACKKYDSNGCSGAGSCVYCDICSNAKKIKQISSGLVQIQSTDGSKLNCDSGIKAGNYTNIQVKFCLPTRDELMKAEGITEEFYGKYGADGQMVFIDMYIVDEKINQKSSAQLQKYIADDNNPHVIGSHKIVGLVKVE